MHKLTVRFLSIFVFISWAWAIEFRGDDSIVVDTPLDETLFAAGSEVNVSAKIDGDAFLAGQTVTVSAPITEDAWLAGNVITVNAKINDDLRAAANTISVSGQVAGDAMLWWNTLVINGQIGGDFYGWWNIIRINKPIKGDVNIWWESVTINAKIWWNATIEAEKISFGSGGSIAGDLSIVQGAQIPENLSWYVWGTITMSEGKDMEFGFWDDEDRGKDRGHDRWFHFNRYRFLTMSLLWALALRLMPNYTRKAADTIKLNPGKTFLYGLLALICIPFIALILLATGVWAPIGWWLIANYIFLWVFLWLFAVVFFADFLVEKWLHEYIGNTLWAKIGVMVLLSLLLTLLPYVATIILGLFGIGTGWLNDMRIIKKSV